MRFIRVAFVVGIAALGGCQTAQQQARNEAQADDAACQSYGLKFGTPAYAECRQRRETASQQQALAALGAFQGVRTQQAAATPVYQMPVRQPVTTTCWMPGGITTCTTY